MPTYVYVQNFFGMVLWLLRYVSSYLFLGCEALVDCGTEVYAFSGISFEVLWMWGLLEPVASFKILLCAIYYSFIVTFDNFLFLVLAVAMSESEIIEMPG